jgi:hypothetical protein
MFPQSEIDAVEIRVLQDWFDERNQEMTNIKRALMASAFGAAIMVGGALSCDTAQAAQVGTSGDVRVAQIEVNIFSGRQYCWYDDAWDGPGWYQCGYSWRRGLGWGGGFGWNSWQGGHNHSYYSGRSGHTSFSRSGSQHSNVILAGTGHTNGIHANTSHSSGNRSSTGHSDSGHSSGNHSSGDHSSGGHSGGDHGPH